MNFNKGQHQGKGRLCHWARQLAGSWSVAGLQQLLRWTPPPPPPLLAHILSCQQQKINNNQLLFVCFCSTITYSENLFNLFWGHLSYNVRIPLQTFCFRNAEAQMAETGFLVEGLQPGHNTRSVILKFLRFLLGGTNILGETHSWYHDRAWVVCKCCEDKRSVFVGAASLSAVHRPYRYWSYFWYSWKREKLWAL